MLFRNYFKVLVKKYKLFFISIILISTLATSLLISTINSYSCFSNSYNNFVNTYKCPDITISTEFASKSILENIASVDGVEEYNFLLKYPFQIYNSNKQFTVNFLTIDESDITNYYEVESVSLPKEDNIFDILIERNFAENNNISLGDVLDINAYGETYKIRPISKVQFVDTIFYQITPFSSSDGIDTGSIYITTSELHRFVENYITSSSAQTFLYNSYNEIYINVKIGYDIQSVLETCLDSLGSVKISNYQTKDNYSSIYQMNNYLKTIKKISIIVPIIFYAVYLIISLLFFMQIIKNNSKDIGLLMMLGYDRKNIISLYSKASLVISSISSVLGVILGRLLLSFLINVYGKNHLIPYINVDINYMLIIISIVCTILVLQLACLISSLELKKVTPNYIFTTGDKSNNSKLKKLNNSKLHITTKVGINFIFRSPKRSITTIISFVFSFIIIFLSLSINSASKTSLNQLTNFRLNYDAEILVLDALSEEKENELINSSFITKLESIGVTGGTIGEETTSIIILNKNHTLLNIPDANGKSIINLDNEGIVIDKALAEKLNVSIGDTIVLNDIEVKITNISSMYYAKSIIMTFNLADKLGFSYYSGYLCNTTSKEELQKFFDGKYVTTLITFTDSFVTNIKKKTNAYYIFTTLLIIFSILITFVIICIMNLSSYNDEKNQISTMRVLGHSINYVSKIYLIIFVILFIVSLLISIPVSLLIGDSFMKIISGKLVTYPFVNALINTLITILIITIFYFISHIVLMNKIKKLDLTFTSKGRE